MVTYSATKLTATYSPMIVQFVDMYHDVRVNKYRVVIMTHQTLSLEKYWKLFPATLRYFECEIRKIFTEFTNAFRTLKSAISLFHEPVLSLAWPNFLTGTIIETRFQVSLLLRFSLLPVGNLKNTIGRSVTDIEFRHSSRQWFLALTQASVNYQM